MNACRCVVIIISMTLVASGELRSAESPEHQLLYDESSESELKARLDDGERVGFAVTTRIDTKHLEVLSQLDRVESQAMVDILEATIAFWHELHDSVLTMKDDPDPIAVRLLSTKEAFRQVCAQSRGAPLPLSVSGYYNPADLTLYVGPGFNPSHSKYIAAHEIVHALDHQFAKRLFEKKKNDGEATEEAEAEADEELGFLPKQTGVDGEGRAIYIGMMVCAQHLDAKVELYNPGLIKQVQAGGRQLSNLGKLIGLPVNQFFKRGGSMGYGFAFAMIHFMYHGEDGKYTRKYKKYLRRYHRNDQNLKRHFVKTVAPFKEFRDALAEHIATSLFDGDGRLVVGP